ncbi:MAG: hypothetical protein ACJAS4_002072 [Bacteriovoracaceae bacterium]|jgi:hypothetical protein
MKLLLLLLFIFTGCAQEGTSSLVAGSSSATEKQSLNINLPADSEVYMNIATGIVDFELSGDCSADTSVIVSNNGTDVYTVDCIEGIYTKTFESINIRDGFNGIKVRQFVKQISVNVLTDLVAPSMTIIAPDSIFSDNENAYTLSGTCDDNTATVSGDVGGVNFSANCDGTNWIAGGINVSGLSNSSHVINFSVEDIVGNSVVGTTSVSKASAVPSVTSILAPVNGTYSINSTLDFQLTFDSNINVINLPCLSLNIGGVTKDACYASGSGGNSLIFSYTIVDGDSDIDGVSLASTIDLKTGSIKDSNSNNASLVLNSIPDLALVQVNTVTAGPDAVEVLNQTNLSVDRTQASFSWVAPNGNGNTITKYIVRYKKSSESEYSYWGPDPVTTNTTITSLSTEELYDVQVAAFNGVIGPYSAVLQFSTIFNPASLGALIWFEAKDINGNGIVVPDGTSITTLIDKSGNGNNAAKLTGTDATVETVDGYKVLRLGASGYRTINSLGEENSSEIEVYVIAKTREITNSFAFVNENQGNNNRYGTHFPWGNGNAYIDLPMGNRMSGPWGGNTDDFIAWTFRASTTQGKALERDGDEILAGGNRTLNPPLKKWTIGSDYAGTSKYWKADLQAMFVFEKILDAQQRADFFQYVEDEYGVVMP